jgi:hypothetical protein
MAKALKLENYDAHDGSLEPEIVMGCKANPPKSDEVSTLDHPRNSTSFVVRGSVRFKSPWRATCATNGTSIVDLRGLAQFAKSVMLVPLVTLIYLIDIGKFPSFGTDLPRHPMGFELRYPSLEPPT